ncbi:MAG: hypothetical protein O3B74_04265 [Proteobacteria bacterium]|nr:hypothetical protein [Pseudomonadota bacterium]MDA1309194.1 hypothetical protein [Pseudomonadota bacterium]
MLNFDASMQAMLLAGLSLSWKIFATAGIVIATGRLARSAGPVLTSVLVALPVNAAPGMFFVALALDADFVTEGVLYSMAGAGPVLVYLTVFVQAARLRNFYLALPIGLAGWIFAAWLIAGLQLDVTSALVCVAAGVVFAMLFNRRLPGDLKIVPVTAGWRYLLIRGGVAGVLIVTIATVAGDIGPVAAGLLLSFPTTLSTTGWMLNGHFGLDFVAATYSSARKALSLYVLFCLILLGFITVLPGPLAVVAAFAVVATIGAVFAVLFVRIRMRASV